VTGRAPAGLKLSDLRNAVKDGAIEWHRHVLERMVERGISREQVINVLLNGERIEDYPDDYPLPSALFLGWVEERPFHVVAAYSADRYTVYVITVYEPARTHFENDFRTRRKNT